MKNEFGKQMNKMLFNACVLRCCWDHPQPPLSSIGGTHGCDIVSVVTRHQSASPCWCAWCFIGFGRSCGVFKLSLQVLFLLHASRTCVVDRRSSEETQLVASSCTCQSSSYVRLQVSLWLPSSSLPHSLVPRLIFGLLNLPFQELVTCQWSSRASCLIEDLDDMTVQR